jgi:predicted dinucleotide-binding enzyme
LAGAAVDDPHRPFATIDCRTANKLLVDITNPINSDFMDFVTPKDSFGALEIAKAAPANADIVKAFNTQFSQPRSDHLACAPLCCRGRQQQYREIILHL